MYLVLWYGVARISVRVEGTLRRVWDIVRCIREQRINGTACAALYMYAVLCRARQSYAVMVFIAVNARTVRAALCQAFGIA